MHCMLLCLLELLEAIRCVLLYLLEMLRSLRCHRRRCVPLCMLEVWPEVMYCVLLYSLKALEVLPEVICTALYAGRARGAGRTGDAGGDTLCATLYAGGCGGWDQFRDFEI